MSVCDALDVALVLAANVIVQFAAGESGTLRSVVEDSDVVTRLIAATRQNTRSGKLGSLSDTRIAMTPCPSAVVTGDELVRVSEPTEQAGAGLDEGTPDGIGTGLEDGVVDGVVLGPVVGLGLDPGGQLVGPGFGNALAGPGVGNAEAGTGIGLDAGVVEGNVFGLPDGVVEGDPEGPVGG